MTLFYKNHYTTICFVSFVYSVFNEHFARFSLLVGPSGLEPPTSCLSGTRSNLLSYDPMWLVCFITLGFFGIESRFLCSPTVLALSYFPGPLPAKYLRRK